MSACDFGVRNFMQLLVTIYRKVATQTATYVAADEAAETDVKATAAYNFMRATHDDEALAPGHVPGVTKECVLDLSADACCSVAIDAAELNKAAVRSKNTDEQSTQTSSLVSWS